MFDQKRLYRIGIGFLFLFITLLTVKFLAWNHWKVRQCKDLTKGMYHAPAAVNITLSTGGIPFYARSFPFNRNGGFYILDRALPSSVSSSPTIPPVLADLTVTLNGAPIRRFVLYPFDGFYILHSDKSYLVLTASDRPIETIILLTQTLPELLDRLPSLEGIQVEPPPT